MSQLRLLVDSLWRLTWESREAVHTEELFVPFNPWREGDLCPPTLGKLLNNPELGAQAQLKLAPGDYLPQYLRDKVQGLPRESFAKGTGVPRLGRFYPQHLLLGHSGNMMPFRCTGVENGKLTADFNHPLAGAALTLEVRVQDIKEKRAEKGGECQDWLDHLTTGPGMQARSQGISTDFFADDPFYREDNGDDARFYRLPRLVSHIDSRARETLAGLYGRLLRPGLAVLDLMSSWQSHLPEDLELETVTGLGLNDEELRRNPRLTDYVLHDLNRAPGLPFEDGQFDAVLCNLSVEYLVRPFEVFAEAARVLKPGGLFIQTFSNRWFPPKAVRIWTELHEFERLGLVLEYFLRSKAFGNFKTFSSRGWPRPADDRYLPQIRLADPVYAVWGEKQT